MNGSGVDIVAFCCGVQMHATQIVRGPAKFSINAHQSGTVCVGQC